MFVDDGNSSSWDVYNMVLEQICFTKLQGPDLKHPDKWNHRKFSPFCARSADAAWPSWYLWDAASASCTFACIRLSLHIWRVASLSQQDFCDKSSQAHCVAWTRSHQVDTGATFPWTGLACRIRKRVRHVVYTCILCMCECLHVLVCAVDMSRGLRAL